MPKAVLQAVGRRWCALFGAPAAPVVPAAGPVDANDELQAFHPEDGEPEWPRASFGSDPPAIDNPILESFRAWWQAARGARAMPSRATVSAAEWHGRYMSDFDALYLPLSDDGIAANHVMSVITFNYETFRRTGNASALTRN